MNRRALCIALVALLALPAAPFEEGVSRYALADQQETSVVANVSLGNPAFIYLVMTYYDGGTSRLITLNVGEDVTVFVSCSLFSAYVHLNPIPVCVSETIILQVATYGFGRILYNGAVSSGAAGTYRLLQLDFNDSVFDNALWRPTKVLFRPYDASTGAGLPIEQFNITVQWPEQQVFAGGNTYYASGENPIALGYLDTYFNLNLTVRVRDYFGNLLYNQTRRVIENRTNLCMDASNSLGTTCTIFAGSSFYIWDIPLTVYSFKVFNQKPDQFIKTKLYWNGTGAGEEVFAPNSGLFPPWWDAGYAYRERLKIDTTTEVPTNYSLNLSLLASSLTGKIEADYRDLRVVYWNGSAWTELNRSYDGSNLYFPAQGAGPMPDTPANGSWHFEEGTGTAAADFSGNGLTATLFSGPTWATGRYGTGYSVTLDGSNDYIQATGSSTVEFRAGDFTVEAWFLKPSTTTGYDNWFGVAKWNTGAAPGTNEWVLALGDADGTGEKPSFEIESGATTYAVESSGAISLNSWTHLAGVREGTNTKIYMNGVLVGTQAIGTVAVNEVASRKVTIGISDGLVGSGFHAAFNVDDVRIYNYSRTPDQIACDARIAGCTAINASAANRDYFLYYGNQLAGVAPSLQRYQNMILSQGGLTNYLPLDETTGLVADDLGPANQDGVNENGVLVGQVGMVGIAYSFDGSNDDVGLSNSVLQGATSGSVEFWFKRDTTNRDEALFGRQLDGVDSELIVMFGGVSDGTVAGDYLWFKLNNAQTPPSRSIRTFADTKWHHIVATWDGSVNLYVDGFQESSIGYASTTRNQPATKVAIGEWGAGGLTIKSPFFGKMDEFATYNGTELTQAQIASHYFWGLNENASVVAAVSLDSSQGFEWFQSPTETVERFLNPGYYQIQIVTDNRTGVQTKANLGVNITEANYYMVSGVNITRFIGDFNSIYTQTQIITNAFRPDVIHIGTLLPMAPSQINAMSIDDTFVRIHPFSILTGTTAYATTGGTNVSSYAPNMTSSSDDGALLTDLTVLKDTFVFQGSVPGQTHVWINYTSNGTNIWENSTLPPSVTLNGIQEDVYVVTNQTVSTVRISDFRAVWEFSFRYYPTDKKYEATLTLNNTMNRTVLNPYWFVGFPENRTVDLDTAAMQDLDNVAWLTQGQHFMVAQAGYYMSFDQLNASTTRRFFFRFYDLNATDLQSVPVVTINSLVKTTFKGDSAYWAGSGTWANPFTAAYRGEIILKLACGVECLDADVGTVVVVDNIAGRELDASEFYTSGKDIHVTASAVGSVPIGGGEQYTVYVKRTLSPDKQVFGLFTALFYLGPFAVSLFFLLLFLEVGFGTLAFTAKSAKVKASGVILAVAFGAILFTLYLMRAQNLVV